jgi:hypothetical protein
MQQEFVGEDKTGKDGEAGNLPGWRCSRTPSAKAEARRHIAGQT